MSEPPPDFTPPDPESDYDERLMENLDKHGWHVVFVQEEDGEGPRFAFSIGMFEKRAHPEVIILGLPPEVANGLLNGVFVQVYGGGERFEPFQRYDDIAEGFSVSFIPVELEHYADYLGYANWYYGSMPKPYPALQMVWPDPEGRLPWEAGYDHRYEELQPLLGRLPH